LEDLGVDGRTLLDLGETGWEGVNRLDVAEAIDKWRTLVNTVMNSRVA
jgi:hypothetical protein